MLNTQNQSTKLLQLLFKKINNYEGGLGDQIKDVVSLSILEKSLKDLKSEMKHLIGNASGNNKRKIIEQGYKHSIEIKIKETIRKIDKIKKKISVSKNKKRSSKKRGNNIKK